ILAKALNCEKGPTSQPCGICDSCTSIASGSSLDVIEIDGASNTSVDNVRQIKDEVLFPPNSGRYKIYIIDEVHMLSTSAFNALLKTIEEPPPYIVFMFATTEAHKVPATIKSRCQQFSFRLVSADILVELLAEAASELGVEAEREALLWIARESGGSVRDAYTLLDQVISFSEGKLSATLIREKLGLVGQDRMNALFGSFVAGDTAKALESLDSILSGGVSAEQFISDAVEYCRALLLIGNGISKEHLLGAPLSSFDLSVPESLGEERIERLLSIFLTSYRALKDSIDPRYELDLAVAKASHIGSYISPGDMAKAVSVLRKFVERGVSGVPRTSGQTAAPLAAPLAAPGVIHGAASAARPVSVGHKVGSAPSMPTAPRPAPAFSPPLANPPATSPPADPSPVASVSQAQPESIFAGTQDIAQVKKALVAEIKRSNILLGTTLDKSSFLGLEGGSLRLEASSRMEYDLIKRFSGILAELLSQKMGSPHRVEVSLPSDGLVMGGGAVGAARIDRVDQGGSVSHSGRTISGQGGAQVPGVFRDGDKTVLSPREEEAVGLLSRFFKGSSISILDPGAADAQSAANAVRGAPAASAGQRVPESGTPAVGMSEPDEDEASYRAEDTDVSSDDYASLERD
ncbi:MAG TPA: DNA polymerase III subunit gamma/tau, partial [Rectinemataceae bacterium]